MLFVRDDIRFNEIQLADLGPVEAQCINISGITVKNVCMPPSRCVTSSKLHILQFCYTTSMCWEILTQAICRGAARNTSFDAIGRRQDSAIESICSVITNTDIVTHFISLATMLDDQSIELLPPWILLIDYRSHLPPSGQ